MTMGGKCPRPGTDVGGAPVRRYETPSLVSPDTPANVFASRRSDTSQAESHPLAKGVTKCVRGGCQHTPRTHRARP